MGCCFGKYDVDRTETEAGGKPEIKLLPSTDDDTAQEHSDNPSPNADLTETLVALYDYISRNAQDLSFRKLDEFTLQLKTDDDWWFVKSKRTGEQGYVPRNFVAVARTLQSERWFFGTLTRKDSERLLLKAGKKGSFLIRESETAENSYSLSLLNEEKERGIYAKHYRIRRSDQGAFYITEGLEFINLPALVENYHDDSHGLCCQLVEPCPIRNTPQTHSLAPRIFKIEEKQFKTSEEIESDSSGITQRARWNDSWTVAVKRYASETNPSVCDSLKKLHHKSIVKFFGRIASEPLSLCWEYLSNGSLSSYLKSPNDADLTMLNLIDIAAQVATGMAYLESSNLPHKCLRSRHVMVGEGPVFKITDYSVYGSPLQTDSDTFLWMSPEAMQNGIHDLKSDVWSFGVLAMEIVTKCEKPENEGEGTTAEFLEKLLSGQRIPRNDSCPDVLYDLLLQCWDRERELRPTFEYIQIFLESFFQRTGLADTAKINEVKPER